MTDHVMLGRAADSRPNSAHEIKSTLVMAVLLDEASAKVRAGGPVDDEEDYALDVWAGVVPLQISAGDPEPDGRLPDRIAVPDYLTGYTRG